MLQIVLECKPDETLMKALGFPIKSITHQPSRGEVINYLKKNPKTIVGVVDEDPHAARPTYFAQFSRETTEKYGIESYQIGKFRTRLILIKPRLEEWILQCAEKSGIDPTQHSMPITGRELHKVINSRLPRFDGFIRAILAAKNPGLFHLKNLVNK